MAITKFTDVADSGYNIAINRDTAHQTERDKFLAGLVTKIDELTDLINTHITDMAANNAKTGITTAQANAITANTAKDSMVLGTTNKTALAGNTTTITGTQAAAITANEKAVTSNTSSITGLTNDMKVVQQNLTVSTATGITARFDNLKVGLKSSTIDLAITDNTGKSPVTRRATITIQ